MIDWCPPGHPGGGCGETTTARRTERRLLALALADEIDAHRSPDPLRARRAADVARALARRMGWSERACALLHEAALLQDVGQAGLPHEILVKPGPLTPGERSLVARHPALGAAMLRGVLSVDQLGWIRHHHERWDGAGYPDGLMANDIAEGATLLGLAAAWTAMTDGRGHRPRISLAEAVLECRAQAGRQFRPSAVAGLTGLAHGDGRRMRRGRADRPISY